MRNIVVCIPNALLAGGVVMYLKNNSDLRVYREDNPRSIVDFCIGLHADVLLTEVRERSPYTIEEWNVRNKIIKKKLPECKIVYMVDENSSPELAERVILARSDRQIDAFLYSTVTGEYLAAVIESL